MNVIMEKGMIGLTENGIIGDPTKSTAKKGKVYLEKTVDFLFNQIKPELI